MSEKEKEIEAVEYLRKLGYKINNKNYLYLTKTVLDSGEECFTLYKKYPKRLDSVFNEIAVLDKRYLNWEKRKRQN